MSNLTTLLESYSVMAIMAAGLLVVLISGGIDISFAAIAAVTQYLVATILVQMGGNWIVAFALSAIFGALLGAVNALLDSLPSSAVGDRHHFDDDLLLCDADVFDRWRIHLRFARLVHRDDCALGNPFPVVVAAVVLIITAFLLNRLSIGRQIYGLWGQPRRSQTHGLQSWSACNASSTATRV